MRDDVRLHAPVPISGARLATIHRASEKRFWPDISIRLESSLRRLFMVYLHSASSKNFRHHPHGRRHSLAGRIIVGSSAVSLTPRSRKSRLVQRIQREATGTTAAFPQASASAFGRAVAGAAAPASASLLWGDCRVASRALGQFTCGKQRLKHLGPKWLRF